jgi:hypothetical protein
MVLVAFGLQGGVTEGPPFGKDAGGVSKFFPIEVF